MLRGLFDDQNYGMHLAVLRYAGADGLSCVRKAEKSLWLAIRMLVFVFDTDMDAIVVPR